MFFTHFLIRPYFDNDFNKADFLDGAKAAVEFVSNCLSSGDLEALEESKAVSPECLKVSKTNSWFKIVYSSFGQSLIRAFKVNLKYAWKLIDKVFILYRCDSSNITNESSLQTYLKSNCCLIGVEAKPKHVHDDPEARVGPKERGHHLQLHLPGSNLKMHCLVLLL